MDVVVLPVKLGEFCPKLGVDVSKERSHVLKVMQRKDTPAVLGDKDEVDMEQKYTVSPASVLI